MPAYILPPYNGFSHEERVATNPIQRDALRRGLIVRPERCSICGFSDPSDPTGRGYLFLHLEDYRHPLEFYGVCKSCHAALHARFRDPARWLRVVRRHGQSGRWFTLLSDDPESQTLPFDQTYPHGLPGEWDVWPLPAAPIDP
ncbi:hypothetical protein [Magnetospirillum sp. 15-1]|uniref:hypothetical protein n=1 Tax=Magnetospirillum sp. 15-1 TaxID=1979370 RepID=UPI000BBCC7B2|nr:hypothetical protein [Magnetospirillum sp. 15-1]